MRFAILLVVAMTGLVGPVAAEIVSSVDIATLPKGKQTILGLYLSPKDAGEALDADPSIVFIDTRDPIEVNFIGHPVLIDAIVPLELAARDFDPVKGEYVLVPNPDFVAQVQAIVAREGRRMSDPLFVMCRSGGRSAKAVNLLAEAGFTNVWNLIEGFEGDKDDEGARTMNGWRAVGLPWAYRISPEQAWIAPGKTP